MLSAMVVEDMHEFARPEWFMAHLRQFVIDSHQPSVLARFWAAVLDDFEIRAYDQDEVARLASFGRTTETDPCVILDGPMLEICFQESDVRSTTKRSMHFDIEVQDRALETTRLISLGASIVEQFDNHTWIRDPAGNDFCLTDS